METLRIFYLLLFFCLHSVLCYPAKPLNERSTELAWQAWLLVDDQNQNKQYDSENLTRRRITPKSVFIAPTFRPESLPACAEGYREDVMRRCIKIIKLDEEAHLGFLEQKLIAQFGGGDDEDNTAEEELSNAGPLQFDFPLGEEQPSKDMYPGEEDVDVAIVITPTNSNFNYPEEHPQEEKSSSGPLNNESYGVRLATGSNNKLPEENHQDETTTLEPTTTTQLSTTEFPITTTEIVEKSTSSLSIETTYITTPTTAEETTIIPEQALFFLEPAASNNKDFMQNNSTNKLEEPPVLSWNLDNSVKNNSVTTLTSNSTFTIDTSINLSKRHHLPVDSQIQLKNPTLDHSSSENRDQNFHHSSHVRFPETQSHNLNWANKNQNVAFPYLSTYASQYLHTKIPSQNAEVSPIANNPKHLSLESRLENRPPAQDQNLEHISNADDQSAELTSLKLSSNLDKVAIFNRRNRDKHSSLWSFPPSIVNSSLRKPIVLRFPGRSVNSRYLIQEHIKPRNSEAFYREFPKEDFSYIFGNHQNHKTTNR